jgi:Tfp pilus assembly protein PilN
MNTRSRGAVLWMAIILLAVVAVVIAATMGVLRSDARRTGDEVTGAQLRQLLLAGQASAIAELSQTNTLHDRPVRLPADLHDASLAIKVESAAADRVAATVQAKLAATKREQSLVYTHQNGGWRLESAALP